ncbi:MAG: phosphotransferase family protein [Myxococcales bacterium]|nr:phosphotransferase family protein [Myxococcales bacterium]
MNASTRDLDALGSKLKIALEASLAKSVTIDELAPLSGGACQDNYRVRATIDGVAQRYALRSDAARSLTGSINRRDEHAVIERARRAGVKTPAASCLTESLVAEGRFAYLLDWVDGEAIGRRVVKAPQLADARAKLPAQLANELAKIHSITPDDAPSLRGLAMVTGPEDDPCEGALRFLRATMNTLPEPHPALEFVCAWLAEHRPSRGATTLVHGDFRVGNFMIGPEGLRAVLDWEFAHWGDPAEDVAWLCVRDWRFGELALAAGGVATRDAWLREYERASGTAIDRARVRWWEIMGNARWAAGSVDQGERYLSGAESDIELLAIARRAAEMEWEALRLIRG